MTRKGYTQVSIPDTLIEQIDVIVAKKKDGYASRAEFIKQAIREKLKDR